MPLTGPQKAMAAFIISTLGGIITVLITQLPENADVQLYGGIIAGVLTVLATTLGVYSTPNKVEPPA